MDGLRFDWDKHNVAHVARHEVSPEEVEQVFANGPRDLQYEVVDGEERWTVIGHTNDLRVLIVVWTLRKDAIRTVTARQASRRAREAYLRVKRNPV